MKVIVIILVICFTTQFSQGQNVENYVGCEMYVFRWSSRTTYAITVDNIKERYDLKIDNKLSKYVCLCRSYSVFRERLIKGGKLEQSSGWENINALVEFTFNGDSSNIKQISIAFDADGNYFFENNWYKIDKLMYYYIFGFLNNNYIQESVLEAINKEIIKKNICWGLVDEE